jgi:hypothetical protein
MYFDGKENCWWSLGIKNTLPISNQLIRLSGYHLKRHVDSIKSLQICGHMQSGITGIEVLKSKGETNPIAPKIPTKNKF